MDASKLSKLHELVRSPHTFHKLVNSITFAISRSEKSHPVVKANLIVPSVTAAEQSRRLDWCIDYAMTAAIEKGWALDRVCDTMYAALVAWLGGINTDAADKRSFWSGDE